MNLGVLEGTCNFHTLFVSEIDHFRALINAESFPNFYVSHQSVQTQLMRKVNVSKIFSSATFVFFYQNKNRSNKKGLINTSLRLCPLAFSLHATSQSEVDCVYGHFCDFRAM